MAPRNLCGDAAKAHAARSRHRFWPHLWSHVRRCTCGVLRHARRACDGLRSCGDVAACRGQRVRTGEHGGRPGVAPSRAWPQVGRGGPGMVPRAECVASLPGSKGVQQRSTGTVCNDGFSSGRQAFPILYAAGGGRDFDDEGAPDRAGIGPGNALWVPVKKPDLQRASLGGNVGV